MARIYYRCEPFSKADVTLALESGVDGVIVPRAQVEKVAALSRCTVWACEDVASVPLNVKADEEALVARLKAGETACLARGWEIIPVENLLAQADNVLAEAGKGELNPAALQGAGNGLIVTPKDIDTQVHDLAKVIGYGINLALHTGLTIEDVELFLS